MAEYRADVWPVYGGDELLEHQVDVVVIPRLCEHCLAHLAVYYDCSWWPASYVCRICIDSDWLRQRQALALE